MLKKYLKLNSCLFLCLTVLAFSSLVHAEAGWTDYTRIAELIPTSRHYYEVKLPVKNNPSGCSNNVWFYQDYGTEGSDKMFQTLLNAIQSGNKVRVYVTGKCNVNGYSDFTAVGIIP